MKRFSYRIHSFGCRVNRAERGEIERKMDSAGFVSKKDHPDIFIMNTCSVTHKAEREARNLVHRIKRESPKTKLVVTGCASTYWLKNGMNKTLPVDLLVDNMNKEYLVALLMRRCFSGRSVDAKGAHRSSDPQIEPVVDKFLSSSRLIVKTQDGCHRFCTYCIVPYLRGLPKSKSVKDIIDKINNAGNHISEAILTAINTESYGQDTGESFVDLATAVLKRTKVPRVSFGSVHPWSITDDFITFYKKVAEQGRLVHFFHVPLQSGSNKTLALMKRQYTREEMLKKIQRLTKVNPYALIATDVIVGFLAETQTDFQHTYEFLEAAPIHRFHVFRFSRRRQTAAYYMSRHLKEPSERTKKTRSKALRQLSERKFAKFQSGLVGKTQRALILNKRVGGNFEALLDNQVPIYVKASKKGAGKIKTVKVEQFKKERLFGRIV